MRQKEFLSNASEFFGIGDSLSAHLISSQLFPFANSKQAHDSSKVALAAGEVC
jgi:hypothetical protein